MLRNMKICLWQNKINSLFRFYLLRNMKICLRKGKARGLFKILFAEKYENMI